MPTDTSIDSSVIDRVRAIVTEHVEPHAADVDRNARYPAEAAKALADAGIMGLAIGKAYGGMEANAATQCAVTQLVSNACSSSAFVLTACVLGVQPVAAHGSDDQKKRLLPAVASGRSAVSFAITEPNAGSDAANVETKATRVDGGWVLNGTKRFVGNGGHAQHYVVSADTGPLDGAERSVSTFIIDADNPGLRITEPLLKMGARGSAHTDLVFETMQVPDSALLGPLGRGMQVAMAALDLGRLHSAAWSIGVAQSALRDAISYAKRRKQFGQALIDFQNTQFELSGAYARFVAARSLMNETIAAFDEGRDVTALSATVKLYASEMAERVVDAALQIHGGLGYVVGTKVERQYRDVRIGRIAVGTSEIQKIVIARQLKNERAPHLD